MPAFADQALIDIRSNGIAPHAPPLDPRLCIVALRVLSCSRRCRMPRRATAESAEDELCRRIFGWLLRVRTAPWPTTRPPSSRAEAIPRKPLTLHRATTLGPRSATRLPILRPGLVCAFTRCADAAGRGEPTVLERLAPSHGSRKVGRAQPRLEDGQARRTGVARGGQPKTYGAGGVGARRCDLGRVGWPRRPDQSVQLAERAQMDRHEPVLLVHLPDGVLRIVVRDQPARDSARPRRELRTVLAGHGDLPARLRASAAMSRADRAGHRAARHGAVLRSTLGTRRCPVGAQH